MVVVRVPWLVVSLRVLWCSPSSRVCLYMCACVFVSSRVLGGTWVPLVGTPHSVGPIPSREEGQKQSGQNDQESWFCGRSELGVGGDCAGSEDYERSWRTPATPCTPPSPSRGTPSATDCSHRAPSPKDSGPHLCPAPFGGSTLPSGGGGGRGSEETL